MRPLRGVVTRASNRALAIRLESGKLVEGPNEYNLSKYDRVVVRYDFTENTIVGVEPHDPEFEAKEASFDESDPAVLAVEEENEDHLEPLVLADSGALCLSGDDLWDPASGVLVSEEDE